MSELTLFEAEGINQIDKENEVGSHNHSAIQANLAHLFKTLGSYSVFVELSLDVEKFDTSRNEIKPDVCIYPKRGLSRPYDILKMDEMPLLAIEILSPRQAAIDILETFEVYFALGVQSCWLVDPTTEIVAVYTELATHQSYSQGDVIDDKLNIRLPLNEIFE